MSRNPDVQEQVVQTPQVPLEVINCPDLPEPLIAVKLPGKLPGDPPRILLKPEAEKLQPCHSPLPPANLALLAALHSPAAARVMVAAQMAAGGHEMRLDNACADAYSLENTILPA